MKSEAVEVRDALVKAALITLVISLVLGTVILFTGCQASASGHQSPPKPEQPDLRMYAFTANWCGPCQRDKAALAELQQQGYTVIHIDIDAQPSLAAKYQVTSVPTYVVIYQGKEETRTCDLRSVIKLLNKLRPLHLLRTICNATEEQTVP